jgi:hypothetical protein
MRRISFSGALLLLMVVSFNRARAQESASAPDTLRHNGVWAALALGGGGAVNDGGGVLFGLSVQIQQRAVLWNIRADDLATGWESDVSQYALQLGRASTDTTSHFRSASAGIAYVHRVRCESGCGLLSDASLVTHASNTVGVSFAGEMAVRRGKRKGVGIGLTAVGNINPQASFATVGLSFSAGRWR